MDDVTDMILRGIYHEREADDKHPGYDREMRYYNLIASGKVDEVIERSGRDDIPAFDDKIRGVLSPNPLRNAMYHFVTMTALVSRMCIANGLDENTAYKISDAFINRADAQKTPEDIRKIKEEMVLNYARAMQNMTTRVATSKQITKCVNYISEHLHDNLSVKELSEWIGLNETYLSKLFKKEMGCTVSEYIREKKIEEACWLLKYSDKSSIEISTDLSFSSHSYFISVFKKVTGKTPKEYRNENFRKL